MERVAPAPGNPFGIATQPVVMSQVDPFLGDIVSTPVGSGRVCGACSGAAGSRTVLVECPDGRSFEVDEAVALVLVPDIPPSWRHGRPADRPLAWLPPEFRDAPVSLWSSYEVAYLRGDFQGDREDQ